MTTIQPIGAHVSSSGGIWTAVERGAALEAEAIQIFGSAPQTWRKTNHTPAAFERFRLARAESSLRAVWLHCPYLPNLAHEDDEMWEKSIDCVVNALTVADGAGADGVVLHTGSHRGKGIDAVLPRVAAAIERIMEAAPGNALLALENAAGQGGTIGKSFEELGAIFRAVATPRLAVCLDTCHAYAGGYDIAHPEGMQAMLEEADREVGLDRLAVIHANDSKMEFGSTRDRHENIGDGHIGSEGFRNILATPELQRLPMLLEVPGLDGKGPDFENVRRLKQLRDEVRTT
ncbi:MAG: deoxyribonuclease IV [Dehalococcoidia bacterium]|nr:deoxyribonuclease IV [Dehalococcoidia bacterium]HRC61823.1 deoxyribonuclease IV [Dehalococcoidia bacterium]